MALRMPWNTWRKPRNKIMRRAGCPALSRLHGGNGEACDIVKDGKTAYNIDSLTKEGENAMGNRNPYNIQGYRPPQKPIQQPAPQQAQQWQPQAQQPQQWPYQQAAPQYAPNQYQGMQQTQTPGNAPAAAQEPAQAWQGNYTTQQQRAPRRAAGAAKRGKDKMLLISAIISTAWLIISFCIIRGALSAAPVGASEAEQLGYQIGTAMAAAMLVPFLVITAIGAIFNWCAWGTGKKGLALTAGILFSVSLIFGFSYALGVIPCVVLSFVGYARLKKKT